jgi:hypothetical protein
MSRRPSSTPRASAGPATFVTPGTWGYVLCGSGCRVRIYSTPKNQGNHAKDIRRAVDRCPHGEEKPQ